VVSIGFTQREESTESSVTPHEDDPPVVAEADASFNLSQRSDFRIALAQENAFL
jgi:hypothetical protein